MKKILLLCLMTASSLAAQLEVHNSFGAARPSRVIVKNETAADIKTRFAMYVLTDGKGLHSKEEMKKRYIGLKKEASDEVYNAAGFKDYSQLSLPFISSRSEEIFLAGQTREFDISKEFPFGYIEGIAHFLKFKAEDPITPRTFGWTTSLENGELTLTLVSDTSQTQSIPDAPYVVQKNLSQAYELYKKYYMPDRLDATWDDFINDWRSQASGVTDVKRSEEVVVTLTTDPARIETTWLAIESLLRQTEKPDRIVLNLFEGEFPGRSLPNPIREQMTRGLEINWSKDFSYSENNKIIKIESNDIREFFTISDLLNINRTRIKKGLNNVDKNFFADAATNLESDIGKVNHFFRVNRPHEIYVKNSSDQEKGITLKVLKEHVIHAGEQINISSTQNYLYDDVYVQAIPSEFGEKNIELTNSSHVNKSIYLPDGKMTFKIPPKSSQKVKAPAYAFFTGVMQEESFKSTFNIYKSGYHWAIDIGEKYPFPLLDREIVFPYFEDKYYRSTYNIPESEDALTSFLTRGWKEGNAPNYWFPSEMYGRYFETQGNPFVDFILQRQIAVETDPTVVQVIDNGRLEDALLTLSYQLRYKVLPQYMILYTSHYIDTNLSNVLRDKNVIVKHISNAEIDKRTYSEQGLTIESYLGDSIHSTVPWFKHYQKIVPSDVVGKKFIWGRFDHGSVTIYSQFTMMGNGQIQPSPHKNERGYRFTEDGLEILNEEGSITTFCPVMKKSLDGNQLGIIGTFKPLKNMYHFLYEYKNEGIIEDISQIRISYFSIIKDFFSDILVDKNSRFEYFYIPNPLNTGMSQTTNNKFELEYGKTMGLFDHELSQNRQRNIKKMSESLVERSVLEQSERVDLISHHLWVTNAETICHPKEDLLEIVTNEYLKMDINNNWSHYFWCNVILDSVSKKFRKFNIEFEFKNPNEAFDKIKIKEIFDNLTTGRYFGVAVNPLKFAILNKFGGMILDLGVVLKDKYYENHFYFSQFFCAVPEYLQGIDIYFLASKSRSKLYSEFVKFLNSIDDLTFEQRKLIKFSALGDVCWIGQIITYLFDTVVSDTALFSDFGYLAWTQRSRTWIQATHGNQQIRFSPEESLENKTILPIFKTSLDLSEDVDVV